MATIDRDHPLRVLLDAALANREVPSRSEVGEIALHDDVTEREARRFSDSVIAYSRQIVELAQGGDQGEARRVVVEAVEELGDLVDTDAAEQDRENPRDLAARIPRASAPTRRTRIDAERDEALSRITR